MSSMSDAIKNLTLESEPTRELTPEKFNAERETSNVWQVKEGVLYEGNERSRFTGAKRIDGQFYCFQDGKMVEPGESKVCDRDTGLKVVDGLVTVDWEQDKITAVLIEMIESGEILTTSYTISKPEGDCWDILIEGQNSGGSERIGVSFKTRSSGYDFVDKNGNKSSWGLTLNGEVSFSKKTIEEAIFGKGAQLARRVIREENPELWSGFNRFDFRMLY